ncbi:S-adenosyl-L-methionine-dependent methyltransferase [Fistulina hepatica ATCC 64428]|nr:S-adenosyl-L-methionine-dependent methyltransferase [Fistulina hepatica ATCC 64428]
MSASSSLQPSKLGTKDHWDNVYAEELSNYHEIGDEGEIWFGEESVAKMVEWTEGHVPPSTNPAILEIGCGNATLLFALLEAGFDGRRLAGIDYSPGAVDLARAIAETRDTGADITLSVCDFLTQDPPHLVAQGRTDETAVWDLLLDKGTFDAIALGPKDKNGLSPAAKYPARVSRLLRSGGHFLITSCNFTEDELKESFITPETGLTYRSRIQHPTITFGGKSGSMCCSVGFTKS